jgi:molybdate transport system ATP-binding protein
VRLSRQTFTLDAAFRAEPGEVLAILGPNGAGKSTLLDIVSGLTAPHEGSVILGGRTLTAAGVAVPPAQRRIGLMGQDPLLFPHLTAAENIAFGPRAQGASKAAARTAARDWLTRFGLAEFADRKPARLSGGQRQRVALARALAAKPDLLLLDEPLGALDAQTAPEIRQLLRTHIRAGSLTTLLVTHDVLDAATLADRVIVLEHGAIVDSGSTATVLAAPRSSFTAALAGLNMVTGMTQSAAEPGAVTSMAAGGEHTADPMRQVSGVAAEPLAPGAAAIAVFPPAAVAVYLEPPAVGSPRNTWPATVVALERGPSAIRVRAQRSVSGGGTSDGVVIAADLTPAAVSELGLQPGMPLYLAVKATEVRIHAR